MPIAQSVDDALKIANGSYSTTGILLLMFIVMVLAAWKFASWSSKHIDTLVTQALLLITKLNLHLDSVGETLKLILKTMDSQADELVKVNSKVEEVNKRVELLDKHLIANAKQEPRGEDFNRHRYSDKGVESP